ncbi:TerB N-terminal domain-containing protein [Blastococcus sp. KM273129]|uniref:TerB N-terminal domain-containing protein n=1 Tax=Blastococcus sp. KM273129 TaxID=2570315 RepID=UPI001F2F15CD|nr:TerB N-terminal domain-containing protein [Blastococcus sp. KM273129]
MPHGTVTTIAGLPVHGGLLYVGSDLPSVRGYEVDPSLIDPALPIDLVRADSSGLGLGYWPSYSHLTPAERGGFLRWLAQGRTHPQAPIGFVFIYFYGLERRLLHDLPDGDPERVVLLQEVRRLLDLYGENHSFRGYATNLLQWATPLDGGRRYLAPPPAPTDWGYELPFDVCIGLGQLLADGHPIPPAWAQAWWQQHPETRTRAPVKRCPEQFAAAFATLYRRRFGDGLVVKENKKRLQLDYRPASAGLPGHTKDLGLPDVRGLRGPVTKFAEIAEQATHDLDPYSRYLGRSGADPGSPAALAVLPPYLDVAPSQSTQDLLNWVRGTLGTADCRRVPAVEIISRWPASRSDRLNKAETELLATLLERHGVGIEPDVRFGSAPPTPTGDIVLFPLPGGASARPTAAPNPDYVSAVALLQLAAAVAAADGSVADEETTALLGHLSRGLALSATEQARLHAHLHLVLRRPPTPAALRKRAATLDDAQRQQAAQLLLAVAAADGTISPTEIDQISRLFTVLGFEATDAYAQIHAAATTTRPVPDPLTPARTAGTAAGNFALPPRPPATVPRGRHAAPQPADTAAPLQLDPHLLARTRRDSEQVAALLADIFIDTDPPAHEPEAAIAAAQTTTVTADHGSSALLAGLDAPHSELLRSLTEQTQWARAAFAALCSARRLLPDGALDTLNEAAVEATGEPVCEGHDPIEINSYALEEMLR